MWHQVFKRNFENQWEYFVRKNNNLLNNSWVNYPLKKKKKTKTI